MPIEIRELVIKASLSENVKEDKEYNLAMKEDLKKLQEKINNDTQRLVFGETRKLRKEILEACVEEVREMMNQQTR